MPGETLPRGELLEEHHRGFESELQQIFAEFCLAEQLKNQTESNTSQAGLEVNHLPPASTQYASFTPQLTTEEDLLGSPEAGEASVDLPAEADLLGQMDFLVSGSPH